MTRRKQKNLRPIYFRLLGAAWILFIIFLLVKVEVLRNFGADLFACSSCVGASLFSLGLYTLLFSIGALSLAYGVLLGETELDLRSGRVVALACAIVLASLIIFGWVNFAFN